MDAGVNSKRQRASYPPPTNFKSYVKKPLPALPPYDRRSLASSFSSEVDNAFTTPKTPHDGCPLIFEWEREGSGKSVRLSYPSAACEDGSRFRLRRKRQPTRSVNLVVMNQGAHPFLLVTEHHEAPLRLRKKMSSDAETDEILEPPHRQTLPAISSYKLKAHAVPPDEILSPQPRASVQKILKLTGNMNASTILSQDTPSLHNSSQKIRQLTGLDVGLHQLHPVEEEVSAASSEASSSSYSLELEVPEDASYEPAESVYSPSYAESVNEVLTPLTIPRYINPISINRHLQEEVANETPVAAALRLSGFVAVGASLAPPEEPSALQMMQEIPPSPPDSTYQRDSDAESVASMAASSSDESESALELEPTAGMLYHDTAISIAKSIGNCSNTPPSAGTGAPCCGDGPTSAAATAAQKNNRMSHRSSGGLTADSGNSQSPTTTSSTRPFSLKIFRKKEPGLSERRGRAPAHLDSVTAAAAAPGLSTGQVTAPTTVSSSSSWKHASSHQRTPYPPVSSSIKMAVQESEDNQARFSLLARIFNGAGGSASSSGSGAGGGGAKRESMLSSGSTGTAGSMDVASAAAAAAATGVLSSSSSPPHILITPDQIPTSTWSPETPDPPDSGGLPDENESPGILSRTLDRTRQAAGLRTKAERAERKRETLRGKIKVLRSPGAPRASMADDGVA